MVVLTTQKFWAKTIRSKALIALHLTILYNVLISNRSLRYHSDMMYTVAVLWWKPRAWCNIISILPNKKLFQGLVNRPNVNDQLQALYLPQTSSEQQYSHLQHHYRKKNNSIKGFTFFSSTLLKVPTHTYTAIIIINNELPDISLRVGRSKVGISDRQALQVGRLRCLGRRLTINSYQMYIFHFVNRVSFSASIVFFFIACFHFKVLCVKFDLI